MVQAELGGRISRALQQMSNATFIDEKVLAECMGDWSAFMDKIDEVVPMDQQSELMQKLTKGNFTLRIMYEQFQNIQNMGPLSQVMSMVPGFSQESMPKGCENESHTKVKKFITMMDSMTNEQLDSSNPKLMTEMHIYKVAHGSGRSI
ncbi:unnamed protein product [Sphagnum troendelagicum]|uniref:Signal recognition particle SRP54 subunit M-domain domain-containing protein n=1 Tax=Sphagnum troendelagicum TaxID=128251 RepID=A0ABP0UQ95_9BRYO